MERPRRPDYDPPPAKATPQEVPRQGARPPPGPPPGPPPALTAQGRKRPPPSEPPPENARRELVVKKPTVERPSEAPAKVVAPGRPPPPKRAEAKTGGRAAPALPAPGSLQTQSAAKSTQQEKDAVVEPRPPPVDEAKPEGRVVEVKPTREERAAPPYRPPPGAPPGKPPPRAAPPPQRSRAGPTSQNTEVESVKGAPKGRRPPRGPPPGQGPGGAHVVAVRPAPPRAPAPRDDDDEDDDDDDTPPPPEPVGEPPKGFAPPPPTDPPPNCGVPPPPTDDKPPRLAAPRPPGSGGFEPPAEVDVRRSLKPGRLRVTCVEGLNVHRYGKPPERTKIDAYLRFTLGKHKKAPRKKTQVHKRSGAHVFFDEEIVTFDLVEPSEFVSGGDIVLAVELWDENAWSDDLVASTETSILRLMVEPPPGIETLPLRVTNPATGEVDKATDSGLRLEFVFEPALIGMVVFTLYEGRHLKNMDTVGKQDPYVKFTLGEVTKRSVTHEDGGTEPSFGEEQVELWVDKGAWTEDLLVQVYDEDVGTDDLIGQCSLSLLPYMDIEPSNAKERVYELYGGDRPVNNDGDLRPTHGELLMKIAFLPAGRLTIRCLSAKNLRGGLAGFEAGGRQDPYVVFSLEGQCWTSTQRTHVDQDGGKEPEWNESLFVDVVDQHELRIECFDHDVVTKDDLIGEATLSLLPVFKKGIVDEWVTIRKAAEFGNPKDTGDVHVVLEFDGPEGVRYPQHRPGLDSFDHSDRVNKMREELKQLDAEEKAKRAAKGNDDTNAVELADNVLDRAKPPRGRTDEFTDAQIEAAFHFIDLDKNHYIGAAEIRHVLVCMGELITDEEVDMMIKMVDSDGDGQISYREFYDIVTDPDPAHTNFLERSDVDQDPASKTGALNAKAHDRQKELKVRNKKRAMLSQFVDENGFGASEVKLAFQRYKHLSSDAKTDNRINFEAYCKVLNIEETGETHLLFSLFDPDNENSLDMKEFILGMCNWVDMSHEERVELVFDLYDEDRSGFLSIGELKGILMANHMQSATSVQKKCETIMRQADRDGDGTLSRAEFEVVSQKFPTILFPKLKRDDDDATSAGKLQARTPPKPSLPAAPTTEPSQTSPQRQLVPAS
ncbi:hypothetical protein CTAYLR_007509 [Chrysophaeum taylorii]|uniref:Calmodulin n=1 Tax=Chrysophaeum taylorii TaxID=2483200 RepID=A0AAD7UMD7_9STRA|nr:hypothetical protein CTAYLR_007509 [Chrysophaeum taylorii]